MHVTFFKHRNYLQESSEYLERILHHALQSICGHMWTKCIQLYVVTWCWFVFLTSIFRMPTVYNQLGRANLQGMPICCENHGFLWKKQASPFIHIIIMIPTWPFGNLTLLWNITVFLLGNHLYMDNFPLRKLSVVTGRVDVSNVVNPIVNHQSWRVCTIHL